MQKKLEREWQQLEFALLALEKGEQPLSTNPFSHLMLYSTSSLLLFLSSRRSWRVENQHAPPLEASAILDIRTRAELHDLHLQYTSALEHLKTELSSERDALLREKQLDSDLCIVQVGLEKRLAQLQKKKRQDLTSESAVKYVPYPFLPLFSLPSRFVGVYVC